MHFVDKEPSQKREDFVNKFPDARTFPQITMDGEYIGGFTELDAHLS